MTGEAARTMAVIYTVTSGLRDDLRMSAEAMADPEARHERLNVALDVTLALKQLERAVTAAYRELGGNSQ